jgi:hypothetical protein
MARVRKYALEAQVVRHGQGDLQGAALHIE